MGLFNKRAHQEPAATGTATAPRTTAPARGGIFSRKHGHKSNAAYEPYTMSTRPTFGQWLKRTVLDIVTMAVMGAIGLGVYFADPAPSRSFAIRFVDGEIVYPEFAYPLRKEIIPIWAAALLAALVPIFIILLMQIRVRSFWDVNNGVIGLLYSLITAAVFQVFIKWLIGGLRPHFLAVCKPDISLASGGYNAVGYDSLYYTKSICTGDESEINDALESMPSGHTTAAFAGFVYLSLYLNAKLKVFANYHPAMWKLIAIYAPILGACLIGGALTIDEYHNWYDVFAGAVIGTIMAFSAYRMVYASIWDWRFNHIPLNRGAAFSFNNEAELADALWTRKAGWGTHGAGGFHSEKQAHGHYNNGVFPEGPAYHNTGYRSGGGQYNGASFDNTVDPTHHRKPVPGGNPIRRGDEMV